MADVVATYVTQKVICVRMRTLIKRRRGQWESNLIMQEGQSKEQHWHEVNERIKHWLDERQELIIDFCALSGVYEYKPESPESQQWLKKFCEILIDYVSAGHFEIYYELMREAEAFKDGSDNLGKILLPCLTESTEQALSFNDRYADCLAVKHDDLSLLRENLSHLGEAMVHRFEYEDQLIEAMHNTHRQVSAA